MFFFFKQKTAYEMRISDWSSDVCSSDLVETAQQLAVEGEAVGIVGVGRGEEVPERRLDGRHLVAQGGIGVLAVADEVDRADRGDRPLVDLEGEVDAVLLELDDLRLDGRRKAPGAAVDIQFALGLVLHLGSEEHHNNEKR